MAVMPAAAAFSKVQSSSVLTDRMQLRMRFRRLAADFYPLFFDPAFFAETDALLDVLAMIEPPKITHQRLYYCHIQLKRADQASARRTTGLAAGVAGRSRLHGFRRFVSGPAIRYS